MTLVLVQMGIALLTGIIAYLLVKEPLAAVTSKLLDEDVHRAFHRLVSLGIVAISFLCGVGFFVRGYRSGGDYELPSIPDTFPNWFAFIYNTAAASVVGVYSLLAVFLFICLVQHVGLARARLTGRP